MPYFDYAATTPLDPLVLESMLPYFTDTFANPSSLHSYGQKARRGLENAREQIATALHAKSKEIIFTSGATEAINQVIRMHAEQQGSGHIISSKLEHKAVLASCEYLESKGFNVTYLSPNKAGEITLEAVQEALQPDTFLLTLMLVNNETGVKTDIERITTLCHNMGIFVFCDAVQAFGFETLDVERLKVDALSLSAHKFYGPKGVGALYLKEGSSLNPFLLGGEQERGLRAGTHNVVNIVGMAEAATLAIARLPQDKLHLANLQTQFEQQVLQIEDVSINAKAAPRSNKHSNLRVAGVDGETLLLSLDTLGVAVSAGSACAAGSLEPSHVLTAMGLSPKDAKASIRFSFGRDLTLKDINEGVSLLARAIERCRSVV